VLCSAWGISCNGITALLGITQMTWRLEHSAGVMLLVRWMGAGLDEQIAALLHDVSRTAFSHVIDYVFNNHEHQSYHERMKAPYLEPSDVPAGLAAYGFNWFNFLNEEGYPLLEQPVSRPALFCTIDQINPRVS
jgi:HD superfamily phosphohydrolase